MSISVAPQLKRKEDIVEQKEELVAVIGIDWADAHHDYCLFDIATGKTEERRIEHTPEKLLEFVNDLRQRFGGRQVGICLEQLHGPLIYALMEHDFLALYPVNPLTLAKYRAAFHTSGAKNDPGDAKLLCELMIKHRNDLPVWKPDDEQTRLLTGLCVQRRSLVDCRTKLVQRLIDALKKYFPQAIQLAGDELSAAMACDFLMRWATLDAVKRAKPQTLRSFYYGHNSRSEKLIETRLELIKAAKPLTTNPAIVRPLALTVQAIARLIRDLDGSIAQFDKSIRQIFRQHPDTRLFESLPGAGEQLAPRLLCAFGTDRARYETASDIQCYNGTAPVSETSGKQSWVHWRWHRPIFVYQTFHEFAQKSIQYSKWAAAYCRLQESRGKSYPAICRALAFKWTRIVFRCWKDSKPYDEEIYLASLKKHNSPLLTFMEKTL
jgi:transposase